MLSYGALGTFDNKYIFTSLRVAGTILDKKKRAEEVIGFIQKCQNDLRARTANIPDTEKPTVYVGGLGYKGSHGITSTECGYPLFRLLHAKSVVDASGKNRHMFVDKEKIIAWDPDIVFIDEGGLAHARDDYTKNPEWYNLLKAVRNKRLYGLLPYNYYTTNLGTALADGYYIGKVVYPGRFEDIVPEKKADEIYSFLLGRPVYARMAEEWGGFKQVSLKANAND
jgi:iron complex transport system substrate-binding protein